MCDHTLCLGVLYYCRVCMPPSSRGQLLLWICSESNRYLTIPTRLYSTSKQCFPNQSINLLARSRVRVLLPSTNLNKSIICLVRSGCKRLPMGVRDSPLFASPTSLWLKSVMCFFLAIIIRHWLVLRESSSIVICTLIRSYIRPENQLTPFPYLLILTRSGINPLRFKRCNHIHFHHRFLFQPVLMLVVFIFIFYSGFFVLPFFSPNVSEPISSWKYQF